LNQQVSKGQLDTSTPLPATDCDLLTGIGQIAKWFGLTEGHASARIDAGEIRTFKLRGRTTVYALKSTNNSHWREMAERYRLR
jgi:hypothetical protein